MNKMQIDYLLKGAEARYLRALELFSEVTILWEAETRKNIFLQNDKSSPKNVSINTHENNFTVSIICGDIFHNLKSALEYTYLAMHLHFDWKTEKKIYFPTLKKEMPKQILNIFGDEFYLKYAQTIELLTAANNQDKHRLLLNGATYIEHIKVVQKGAQVEIQFNQSSSEWLDTRENETVNLGLGVRKHYVLEVKPYLTAAGYSLQHNDFRNVIINMKSCLDYMSGLIVH